MFKFLHAADIHLDSPLRGLERYDGAPVDEIRGATRRAFENLTDLAIEEDVAFVLLAGDLYDGDWKDYNTGLFFARQMARLQEAGIHAYVVAGNHDAASQLTKVLRPPDNVHVFATRAAETRLIDGLDVAIHGQGFPSREVHNDLSQHYPLAQPGRFNIGLLHTSLDGRPGHEPYAPCTPTGLRSRGYEYWALGHVHQREVISDAPWIVFPGNIQGRHARETGAKGCTLVSVDEHRVVGVEHRCLDVVRWAHCMVDVAAATTADDVIDRLGEVLGESASRAEGRLLAVRLCLTGASPLHGWLRAHRERVTNECRALAVAVGAGEVWVEKVLFETRRLESQAAALARDDAFGGLLRAIRDADLDAARLTRLGDELADLNGRLPLELRSGDEAIDLTDPDYIRDKLEDVKALLLERLLQQGGDA
ncbi:MAG: DNA repair exonuclease [Gammaproteobacteria bacterium]